jgi:antitoxin component of MazEF toxin-antitoxin module
VRAAMRKLGNSSGVIIPKSMLAEIGIPQGTRLISHWRVAASRSPRVVGDHRRNRRWWLTSSEVR